MWTPLFSTLKSKTLNYFEAKLKRLFVGSRLLPKYQPKRGGDLGWGKLFRFKCGIKNYFQLVKTNLRTQFNCNIDMIENQTQAYISN